jgi:hypothetical protein
VRDILNAGITLEKLMRYMGRILWGSDEKAEMAYTGWSTEPILKPVDETGALALRHVSQSGAARVMESIRPYPRIDAVDWQRFMETRRLDP